MLGSGTEWVDEEGGFGRRRFSVRCDDIWKDCRGYANGCAVTEWALWVAGDLCVISHSDAGLGNFIGKERNKDSCGLNARLGFKWISSYLLSFSAEKEHAFGVFLMALILLLRVHKGQELRGNACCMIGWPVMNQES